MEFPPSVNQQTKENLEAWVKANPQDQQWIEKTLQSDPQQVVDAFYQHLSFGTGGVRAMMGIGTNRLNTTTLSQITQGMANYLLKTFKNEQIKVAISFDSRIRSPDFAQQAACVFAKSNIEVFLFHHLRPTPLLSFACRHLNCHAAIMITASHNSQEYNGYKVYWSDGAQVVFPHDKGIIEQVQAIHDPIQIHCPAEGLPLIHNIGEEVDDAYLNAIRSLQLEPEQNKKNGSSLKIVYTSLHGSGISLMPKVFNDWGFSNFECVESQCQPDGTFPTTKYPNPEEKAALKLGIEQLESHQADLLIAHDPDADRLGIVDRKDHTTTCLNGNEAACIYLEYILCKLKEQHRLPTNGVCVKTIVTTDLFQAIAKAYGVDCVEVLTGFKYIGEKIRQWEMEKDGPQYIFGAEESYGSLWGTHGRDKDAIVASGLIAEIALDCKIKGMGLLDYLHQIWRKYGLFREGLFAFALQPGIEGSKKVESIMGTLRNNPPEKIADVKVVNTTDYSGGYEELPPSNVLTLNLEDGGKIIARPSGTEPKIKFYLLCKEKVQEPLELQVKACDEKLQTRMQALAQLLDLSL